MANPQAVIVAPTLVSDRYVQLGPTYEGGPQLADGAIIPVEKTATPVELDRVYQSLDTIARSLGPNGANRTGALNQLLRSSAGALGGNGELLKSTITELGGAVGTLADNRDNLFATVDNLGQFTNMLARNDGAVRDLNNQLADISAFLASERGNLSTVLATLPPALDDVARFIRDNRDILRTDVRKLANITDILVRQRRAVTEFTNVAPLALGNLTNSYNARSGTLDVRPVLAPELLGAGLDPRALICNLLVNQPGLPDVLAGPADPRSTQVARASVGLWRPPGRHGRRRRVSQLPLGLSLAPIQDLLGLLNAQPSLNALVPVTTGSCRALAGRQAAPAARAAGREPVVPTERRSRGDTDRARQRNPRLRDRRRWPVSAPQEGSTTRPRRTRVAALMVVALFALTGCGLQSLQDLPLPGGAALGPEPYVVTAQFTNVVDLVPNNSVRVNDVPVGVVREVTLAPDGWTAQVVVEVNGAVVLPANATARLRQTSLLGEKFVELLPSPTDPPQGRLAAGAVIPADRTDVGAQVEEVLGALSLLLNGGGVEKVQTIARELNAATTGNEAQLRSLLQNLDQFVGTLDRQKADIVRAIDSLERLSRTLVDQRARIANVIDNLGPGLDVLNQQRGLLVGTLQSLNRLSDVGTDVIRRSQANTVADLRALQPILRNLVEAGDALPGSLQILLTIPFADNSLNVIKGDFANIDVSLQINLQNLLTTILNSPEVPGVDAIFKLLQPPGHDAGRRGRRRRGSRRPRHVDEHGGSGSPAARSRRR